MVGLLLEGIVMSICLSPVVKDWISLYQSSETRTYYLRCLEKVVKVSGLSPERLLELPVKNAKRLILDVASRWVEEGKPCFARKIQITLKGFHYAHDIDFRSTRTRSYEFQQRRSVSR